jgi:hypothetical protein
MLKIEKESDGCVTRLLLTGRVQSDRIACIRSAMNDGCARKILDLSEVTLVDIATVRFLIRCQREGVELAECPPYVREWILRERAQAREPELSNASTPPHSGSSLADGIIRQGR